MAKKQSGAKGKKSDTHGKKDIAKALAALNDIWGDTDPVSFEDVPDGKYQILLKDIGINESKSSGRLQVSWQLKIVSGSFANRMMFKHDGIDTAESLGYFKGGLARLGVECPDDMSDLPDVLDELKGTYASVTSRTKKGSDMANVFFDKALDSDDIDEDISEDPGDPDADAMEETEEVIWEVGERCEVDIDGTNYPGEVTEVNDDSTALITFDDGDTDTYAFTDLIEVDAEEEEAEEEEAEEEEAEEEEATWAKGDECQVDIDGDMYKGVIKKIKDDEATIKFDDGDTDTYSLSELVEVAAEEAEAEVEEEEEAEEEAEAAEDGELALTFEEDAITDALQTKVEKLAKSHEFNPDDYETYKDLIIDISEYLDIKGVFKSPKEIIAAISGAV